MRRSRAPLLVLLAVAALFVAVADPAAAAGSPVTATGDATAPRAFAPADSTGRDLGISTHLSDGRRLWVFGDTFEPGAPRQSAVHPNTAALTVGGQPGTLHESLDANGHRHEFVPLDAAESAFDHGQRFRPVRPQRVYDSRTSPGTALGPGETRSVSFAVPPDVSGPVSAVFNLTGVNNTASVTDLEVGEPTAPERPTTSSLNLAGHETAANLVTAALGPPASNVFAPPDRVTVRNSSSSVDLIVDLVGFVTTVAADPELRPVGPARLYDSADCHPGGDLLSGQSVTVPVRSGSCLAPGTVPADATAVVVELTADGPGSAGATHLTAWAADQPMPDTSNLNVAAHDARANLALVPLSSAGEIRLFNSGGRFRAIVDVVGYVTAGAAPAPSQFVPVAPVRACDTREPAGGCGGAFGTQSTRTVVLPAADVPAGAVAVALNLTVVRPTDSTHLTVWAGGARPVASNLNSPSGAIRAAMVITPVSPDGTISVFNNAGTADVVVDVIGFFAPPAPMVGACPSGERGRMVIWPASVVTVGGAEPPATDRVVVYYTRWVACSAFDYRAQDTGVATYDYRAGQALDRPMRATRAATRLVVSADGTLPPGAGASGGLIRDDFVYLYSCTTTTNSCYVRRAPTTADLSQASSYEYFAGGGSTATWGPPAQQQPVGFSPVGPIPDTQFPASDLSVQWVSGIGTAGSLVMVYEPRWDSGNKPLIVRTAGEPWGPWSDPVAKPGGAQPAVPGCDITALDKICRAFHLDPDESNGSQLWFSLYVMADGKMKYSTLPITVT